MLNFYLMILFNYKILKHCEACWLIRIRNPKYHFMLFKAESSNYFVEIYILVHFPEISGNI